jgi:hypothetical protein
VANRISIAQDLSRRWKEQRAALEPELERAISAVEIPLLEEILRTASFRTAAVAQAEELLAERRAEYYTSRRELLAASSIPAQEAALERWAFSPEDPAVVFARARAEAELEAQEALAARDYARLKKALSSYPRDGLAHVQGPVIRTATYELPRLQRELEIARAVVEENDVDAWRAVARIVGEGEIAQLAARAKELLSGSA